MRINSLEVIENIKAIRKLRIENIEFFRSIIDTKFKTKYDFYTDEISETEYDVEVLFYDDIDNDIVIVYSHPYWEGESIRVEDFVLLSMLQNKLVSFNSNE